MTLSRKGNLTWLKVRRYWELLQVLVERNLKVRYRGSFLGIYWSLLNPLIMTGLYATVFGRSFIEKTYEQKSVVNGVEVIVKQYYYDGSLAKYALAAFTGLVVINFFSTSTTQALTSVVGNGAILNKIRLPVSIFPLSMIGSNIFQLSVGVFPLLAIITLINSGNPLNVIYLLLPCLSIVLVCTGVGFLVSALYVFFRDLPYLYELVVFVLWLSSPIFYPAEFVDEIIRPFLYLNPLFPIIEGIRKISLSGEFNLALIGSSLLSGVIILSLGWICFHLWRNQFMDLL